MIATRSNADDKHQGKDLPGPLGILCGMAQRVWLTPRVHVFLGVTLLMAATVPACSAELGDRCENDQKCGSGYCVAGKCATREQAHEFGKARCRALPACKEEGYCTPDEIGICRVQSTEDCAQSNPCKSRGLCAATRSGRWVDASDKVVSHFSRCIADSNAMCTASEVCKSTGACTARDGWCEIGGEADCRKHAGCPPACTFSSGRCVVGSTEDCKQTRNCKILGMCRFVDFECQAIDDSDCATSCKLKGLCAKHPVYPICEPRNEDDCKQSDECKTKGRCLFNDDRCVKPAAK